MKNMRLTLEDIMSEQRNVVPSLTNMQDPIYTGIKKILWEADFSDINFGDNFNEYDVEARHITSKFPQCINQNELKFLIDEVFCYWFGIDWYETKKTVSKEEMLTNASSAIWNIYQLQSNA